MKSVTVSSSIVVMNSVTDSTEPLELVIVVDHPETVIVPPPTVVIVVMETSDGLLVENHGSAEVMVSCTDAVVEVVVVQVLVLSL